MASDGAAPGQSLVEAESLRHCWRPMASVSKLNVADEGRRQLLHHIDKDQPRRRQHRRRDSVGGAAAPAAHPTARARAVRRRRARRDCRVFKPRRRTLCKATGEIQAVVRRRARRRFIESARPVEKAEAHLRRKTKTAIVERSERNQQRRRRSPRPATQNQARRPKDEARPAMLRGRSLRNKERTAPRQVTMIARGRGKGQVLNSAWRNHALVRRNREQHNQPPDPARPKHSKGGRLPRLMIAITDCPRQVKRAGLRSRPPGSWKRDCAKQKPGQEQERHEADPDAAQLAAPRFDREMKTTRVATRR